MQYLTTLGVVAAVLIAAVTACAAQTVPGKNGVPASRFANIQKGINMSHWFSQSNDLTPKRFTAYNTVKDMDLIRDAGFDHVRLPFNPEPFWNDADPSKIDATTLKHYKEAIQGFLDRGLAVIVDMHPEDPFKNQVATSDAFVSKVQVFWKALAKELAGYDPDKVFFEIMNEPSIDGRGATNPVERWHEINGKLAKAIRESAPKHTLIVSGGGWTGVDQFATLKPLGIDNAIYNFHCYDPFIFTHQGATWGWDMTKFMKGLPYPSSPENVAEAIKASDPKTHDLIRNYGREKWNRAKMQANLKKAADWGAKHNVYLTCNEFGTYIPVAPRESRLQWTRDMSSVLSGFGIGWTMWDYAGGFAVATGEQGNRKPDLELVKALGLK